MSFSNNGSVLSLSTEVLMHTGNWELSGGKRKKFSRSDLDLMGTLGNHDVMVFFFSRLDSKSLKTFDLISKMAAVFSERMYKFLREANHLDFCWHSIPAGCYRHHKWSYLLNDAIVTCLDEYELGGLKSASHLEIIEANKKYGRFIKRFEEFDCFYDIVISGGEYYFKNSYRFEYLIKKIINIADRYMTGGELALKALFAETQKTYPKLSVLAEVDLLNHKIQVVRSDMISNPGQLSPDLNPGYFSANEYADWNLIIENYLKAIHNKATFLANSWIENCQRDIEALKSRVTEEFLNKNTSKEISQKARNESQLLAFAAAKNKDYKSVISMLIHMNSFFIIDLINNGLKLPFGAWLKAARSNKNYHYDILLLYAKVFESITGNDLEESLWEEAANKVAEYKNMESKTLDICEDANDREIVFEYNYDEACANHKYFWDKQASQKLLDIKYQITARIIKNYAFFV